MWESVNNNLFRFSMSYLLSKFTIERTYTFKRFVTNTQYGINKLRRNITKCIRRTIKDLILGGEDACVFVVCKGSYVVDDNRYRSSYNYNIIYQIANQLLLASAEIYDILLVACKLQSILIQSF